MDRSIFLSILIKYTFMCAIAGIIGRNLKNESHNTIASMLSMMQHRGPDFSDSIKFGKGFFGHNRLSIIDTHTRANQPMISNNKRFILVFNGEIYNYLELREQLKSYYNFKTKSDTEVLLAAFQKWGADSFGKLNGAFAFCIYDKQEHKAYFVRDRFGQKPLFFWQNQKVLYFSSEIKAFFKAGYKAKENLLVWHDYLINAETDASRNTFFQDIFQLLPGELVIFEIDKKIHFKKWYQLKQNLIFEKTPVKSEILKALTNSVRQCSRADVEQAISLSGGLDSNILLSLYAKNKFLKKIPKTYSVEFGSDFSEKEFFSISNKKFNNENALINFSVEDMLNSIKPIIWHLESPSGGLMNCALSKLCHAIHKDGIKIVQDGTGLDEIFGGYEIHHLSYLFHLREKSEKDYNKSLELFSRNWGYSISESNKKVLNFQNSFSKTIDGYNVNTDNVFTNNFFDQKTTKQNRNLSYRESMIDFTESSKVPRNNRLKDRVSMAFSVELRLPFLDHELAESALSLPGETYFLNGHSKSILRETVKNLIPEKIRKFKKMSIQTPQNIWFKEEKVKNYVQEIIFSDSFKSRNIFNIKKIQKLWDNFQAKETKTSFFFWQLVNMEEWFRIFIDNNNLSKKNKFRFNYK